jgi:hypothetical protein
MTEADSQIRAANALTLQLLAWVGERPRTYGETLEAWRTSCPRLPVWEDAVSERLVRVAPSSGARMENSAVVLTDAGLARLGPGA